MDNYIKYRSWQLNVWGVKDFHTFCKGLPLSSSEDYHNIPSARIRYNGERGGGGGVHSCMSHRTQYVGYDGTCMSSDYKTILCGIPERSIIGPLLLILYINDLANVSDKLKFILFADDTNVFFSQEKKNVCNVLNKELENMSIRFKVNKLSLNVSKTNYVICGQKYTDSVFNIQINGVVDRVQNFLMY